MQTKNLLVHAVMALLYAMLWYTLAALAGERIHDPLFHAALLLALSLLFTFSYTPLFVAVHTSVRSLFGGLPVTTSAGIAQMIDTLHEQTSREPLVELVEKSLLVLLGQRSARLLLTSAAGELAGAAPSDLAALWQDVRRTRTPVQKGGNTGIPVPGEGGLLGMLVLQGTVEDVELRGLLQFLARQIGIALERIEAQEQRRRRDEAAHDEKIQALATLSANIAHEMRTPLAGVRASIGGVQACLGDLLDAHAVAAQLQPERFAPLRPDRLESLQSTATRITDLVDQANNVIDLLLVNLHNDKLDRRSFTLCSMRACVEEALERYPFRRNERARVEATLDTDFNFLGIHSMMVYVLFNLLRNALYSLEAAGRGSISIRLETGGEENRLVFTDTGLGIAPEVLPHIFDGFFTTRADGTGAGLAFCVRTLASFEARIDATSVQAEYACFTLHFPA
jgi:signal transduction histidine kinase